MAGQKRRQTLRDISGLEARNVIDSDLYKTSEARSNGSVCPRHGVCRSTSTSPRCLTLWTRNAAIAPLVGKVLPRNYGISPQRLTRDVTITQLVRRHSQAWRNGGTPPANMRFLCFAGWAARQRASCPTRRLTHRGRHFRSSVPISGYVGIFKNSMTRSIRSAANGASHGRNSRMNSNAVPANSAV